ncbi:uncharacterized protein SOCE836_041060 [Sorangium cellulosum]|uniref:Uncharacterized protein n=1 Tax=Sorangium cellulosum TaxID=56 RepID=A0A4P2QPB2_SORCE|nr:uncharacterized protein SOCE836_041060 [Sorangium cellulosum]WCQ91343.1 hypothetical protein NQZ70_04061 [Sorangium sp. Soce836]
MVKRDEARARRLPRPAERPLDDGVRYGPEAWREIDGVAFCHWDRWLLRLALAEPSGLDAIARELRARAASRRVSGEAAEAMLAQVVDLRARLARLARTPEEVLDAEERASEWLLKKAWKRVWHAGPNRRTDAMRNTPRLRFLAHALRGNWPRFPVSPARFEPELRRVVGDHAYYDYRATDLVARLLERQIDLLGATAASDLERMALHRAAMTVIIETMDRVDDSLADMSEVFAASERAYLALARDRAGLDGILRDLLELAVWEDYGLLRGVVDFLGALQEEHADLAIRALSGIVAELRRERLDGQLARALMLRKAVLAPWG